MIRLLSIFKRTFLYNVVFFFVSNLDFFFFNSNSAATTFYFIWLDKVDLIWFQKLLKTVFLRLGFLNTGKTAAIRDLLVTRAIGKLAKDNELQGDMLVMEQV